RKDVGIQRLAKVWQGRLGEHEGPSRIDVLHEVVFGGGQFRGTSETDGARIVDDRVDAAELLDGLGDRSGNVVVVADITDNGVRLPARRANLIGRGMDGALELGVGLVRFGEERDVGAVASCAERDGETNASAAARHEYRFSGE